MNRLLYVGAQDEISSGIGEKMEGVCGLRNAPIITTLVSRVKKFGVRTAKECGPEEKGKKPGVNRNKNQGIGGTKSKKTQKESPENPLIKKTALLGEGKERKGKGGGTKSRSDRYENLNEI